MSEEPEKYVPTIINKFTQEMSVGRNKRANSMILDKHFSTPTNETIPSTPSINLARAGTILTHSFNSVDYFSKFLIIDSGEPNHITRFKDLYNQFISPYFDHDKVVVANE